jgi:dienelactone hydrolase
MRALTIVLSLLVLAFPQSAISQVESQGPGPFLASQVQAVAGATDQRLAQVTGENWSDTQARWRAELQEMLGLSPWPEKTPLSVVRTGSVELGDIVIDRLHYQSRPGLYVAANLYRPVGEPPVGGWPAVLYVCGHSRVTEHGRLLGNKTGYQHHGLWFARHGVVCLVIDTVQLGEFHGEHHGTYRLGRWDWISRGYTPAGVEAWNAIRGIDLLSELSYVNAERLAITGRSGGGAYSWFAAALDDRIRAAVPVAGITDLHNHVVDGCVEGHCDCMYFVNYFGWDYGQLAALVAPRPLLFANSDNDSIFPLDGVQRIHRQLVDHYQRLGASDRLGLLITPGPHKDTQELQVGAFKWILKHLGVADEPVIETPALKEIDPGQLAVFTGEVPRDERVAAAASWFTPAIAGSTWEEGAGPRQRDFIQSQLSRLGVLPGLESTTAPFSQVDAGVIEAEGAAAGVRPKHRSWRRFVSEPVAGSQITTLHLGDAASEPVMVHLLGVDDIAPLQVPATELLERPDIRYWLARYPEREHCLVSWRGGRWFADAQDARQRHQLTRRFYLVGQMPEAVMLNDLLAVIGWLSAEQRPIALAGEGRQAGLIELAGLLLQSNASAGEALQGVYVANRTTEPLLTASLPGLLRVAHWSTIAEVASELIGVEEVSFESNSRPLLVDTAPQPQQANGYRIVEVGENSARVWIRATRWPLPNLGDLPGVEFEQRDERGKKHRGPLLPESGVDGLKYAVPGVDAQVRVAYRAAGGQWQQSEWQSVDGSSDYSTVVTLDSLESGKLYDVRTEVRGAGAAGDQGPSSSLSGRFRTLDGSAARRPFRMAVATCQEFDDRDGPHGFDAYRSMLRRKTDALVMAGDVVYYDAYARNRPLAHYMWQRTYGLPTVIEFHRQVPTYFLKDDHDTYVNDSWPGHEVEWTESFTFEDGQEIFRQQTGLPDTPYRSQRINQDLEIWMLEGRDFRSPNSMPDSSEKTILGEEQKRWLMEGLANSTATFRVVISPTPLVGPDRDRKQDNHSNADFAVEGSELRGLLAGFPNTVVVCGDRHWQYHSIDPVSGLHEFSVGPLSDRHAGGWKQEDVRPEHQFLRVAGGYLELELTYEGEQSRFVLRHLDTAGQERHRHELRGEK